MWTLLFTSSQQLWLWVDGQVMIDFVSRGHLVAEMRKWGLQEPTARELVGATLTQRADALPSAAAALASVPASVVEQILQRLRRLKNSTDQR